MNKPMKVKLWDNTGISIATIKDNNPKSMKKKINDILKKFN